MRKGTFSVQTANVNSSKHNSRELAPKYLIDSSQKNYYELIKKDDDFIQEAQSIYKEKIKQTMQKKQVENLIQETVLTLQPHQNENDVKDLFKKLNAKYGGHELLEIAIHRDEGHFLKDDIAYYPTKNILKKDDNNWYICSNADIKKPKKDDFDTPVNIDEFEKIFNYHAHAKFSMFDREIGKSARMQKKDMSSRIKFVSDELGLLFDPNKETSRIHKPVNQIKDEHLARARELEKTKELKQELAKKDDLKKEIDQLKKQLQEQKAARPEYAELEQLNKDLKEQLKNKDLTIDELNIKIDEYKQNKAPRTNENILNDKSIHYRELEQNIAFKNDLDKNLSNHISEKELNIKTGVLGSEKQNLNIVDSPYNLRTSILSTFTKSISDLYEIAKTKAKKFYEDIIKEKDNEIKELKTKVKDLQTTIYGKDKTIQKLKEINTPAVEKNKNSFQRQ